MSSTYKTRTHAVVQDIREMILSGKIEGGEPLRQTALAEALNVSRIPIREALLQLEAEGLVKFEAHKGAVATRLSAKECRELFELRALIETDLLRFAMPHQSKDDWLLAQQILDELDRLLDSGSGVEKWSQLNFEFHHALYAPSLRPVTLETIRGLNANSDRYIRLQLLLTNGIPRAESEHKALLELCRVGDIDGAASLLKVHIENAGNAIASLIEAQKVN